MELSRVDVHTGGRGQLKSGWLWTEGGGGQKSGKFCGRHKWMTPKQVKGFLWPAVFEIQFNLLNTVYSAIFLSN
jgi:hypothetical protein